MVFHSIRWQDPFEMKHFASPQAMAQNFVKGYYTTSVYDLSKIGNFYAPNPVILRKERIEKWNGRANGSISLGIPPGAALCIVAYSVTPVLDNILLNVNGFLSHGDKKYGFGQNFILKEIDDRIAIVSDAVTIYDDHILDKPPDAFYDVPNEPVAKPQPQPARQSEEKPPARTTAPPPPREDPKVRPSQVVTAASEGKEATPKAEGSSEEKSNGRGKRQNEKRGKGKQRNDTWSWTPDDGK
jgi:hypothetical protein